MQLKLPQLHFLRDIKRIASVCCLILMNLLDNLLDFQYRFGKYEADLECIATTQCNSLHL